MNTRLFSLFQRRAFSSVTNYTSPTNPRVFMTIAKGGQTVGDLVFELYGDHQPRTVEGFMALCHGVDGGRSYVGTGFHHGLSDFGISGGKMSDENLGADDTRNVDGDLSLRHTKRGQLTAISSGFNATGSEFTITFGETPTLNGYNTVFGELVDGEGVLDELEAGVNRHGEVTEDFEIIATGEK